MTRIVLVMHEPLGAAFAKCAQHVLGHSPDLVVFDVAPDVQPEREVKRLLDQILGDDPAQSVLILCDLYGATPFNIAAEALRQVATQGVVGHMLTGTNVCMVLKALTVQQDNPERLSEDVRLGALRGIVNADQPCS
ncbi:PTS sugar transporter subunit IIA [Alcaligenaceae bacterium CGII-47]|nr:PTS sugar transporter subunit IIA [Alcaligenaceae bacterium CGII-47]